MRTRFAPSPTGPLHLGHAYSAMIAHDLARDEGGEFLLRIEDTDASRARPEWETAIFEDLAWLGLTWPRPVRRQSEHLALYETRLETLGATGLIFPCSCNRADIRAAANAPHEGEPLTGPDGIVYPGTCRGRSYRDRHPEDALRLNMGAALATLGDAGAVEWRDVGPMRPGRHRLDPQVLRSGVGDVVLRRRMEGSTAYHLAVTVDDAAQGVSHVVRGMDLFEATQIHVLLQALLGLPTPVYHHHDLVRDAGGKRLAKRDDARSIASYRDAGWTAAELIAHLRESRVAP